MRLTLTLLNSLALLVVAAVVLGFATSAHAQGGMARQAREHFQQCLKLKEEQRYCQALLACQSGLRLMPTDRLLELTDKVERLCQQVHARPYCTPGKQVGRRTQNHCCWPGQAWDDNEEACTGVPLRCPANAEIDVEKETCKLLPCPSGRRRIDGVNCCWPRQRYSRSRQRCIYPPRCPEGWTREGETCVKAGGECPAGQVRVSGHCCWSGQRWSQAAARCEGTPKCPAGFIAEDNTCFGDPDGDGIYDPQDGCANEAEDKDGFEDSDGCPDKDNDGDGIEDNKDGCPDEPEDGQGEDDRDGCPG